MRNKAIFYINGAKHEIGADLGSTMLADYLRMSCGKVGTKIVCAEGDCGACTVLRLHPYQAKEFLPVNSCIIPLAILDGSSVVTVEAIADTTANMVQEAMQTCHASQCGFCTPGFVMALAGLLEEKKPITNSSAKNALTGNLCRCTGYQPILDAATSLDVSKHQTLKKTFFTKEIESNLRAALKMPLELKSETFHFYAPTKAKDAATFLKKKGARLIGAATDLGVASNKGKSPLRLLLSLHLVESLYKMEKKQGYLKIGALVSISRLRNALKHTAPEFARFLDLFASPQIKNIATLVGNVANASPIADTPPALLALGAELVLQGTRGPRTLSLDRFFLSYKKTALKHSEWIAGIQFEIPRRSDVFSFLKNSQRKDLDISTVNAAFRLRKNKKKEVEEAVFAFGGVGPIPLRLKKTEALLKNKKLDETTIQGAVNSLQSEISPLSDLRASASYRRIVAENFLKTFLREANETNTP